MKPDWKDAPEWAMWLAMDQDGEWCWFELEPYFKRTYGFWAQRDNSRVAGADYCPGDKGPATKEPRP